MSSKTEIDIAPRRVRAEQHAHALATVIALRDVRRAPSPRALLEAAKEVLVRHVGAEAFVVVDRTSGRRRVLASRGLGPVELASIAAGDEVTGGAPVAARSLGVGRFALGTIVVRRLAGGAASLTPGARHMLEALAAHAAVALHALAVSSDGGRA